VFVNGGKKNKTFRKIKGDGMRSEIEIKERLYHQKKCILNPDHEGCHEVELQWVLEGEPRYSVAELEEITYSEEFKKIQEQEWAIAAELLLFLKRKKKVQEVLD